MWLILWNQKIDDNKRLKNHQQSKTKYDRRHMKLSSTTATKLDTDSEIL